MGKDLRGKELGVGISQRKDGLYTARFTDKQGKRKQAYFNKLKECRKWLADTQFNEEHGDILFSKVPTVDAWFHFWMDNVKHDNIRANTKRNYNDRYNNCIKPIIGKMLIQDVKPIHCQNVLVSMSEKHSDSIIKQCRTLMHGFFSSALENDLITKNPITKNVKCASKKQGKKNRVLTISEQKKFINGVKDSEYYNQWALVLQTGLRVGEMIGLRWSDVDFNAGIIKVSRTMECRKKENGWQITSPKTINGIRDVPLTPEAISILKQQRDKIKQINIIPIEWNDMVFVGKDGTPIRATAYNSLITHYCKKLNIDKFSMHTLRHTFATRCIEAGMKPKTLQIILGHSSLSITMDLYVHVTDDEKEKEISLIADSLKVV